MKISFYRMNVVAMICLFFMNCDNINDDTNSEDPGGLCGELAGSSYVTTAIGGLLAVAHDSSGVLYVIDEVGYQKRVFISNNDTLFRRKVTGSSVLSERYFFLSTENGQRLIFRNESDEWRDVYLCSENRCNECDSILNSQIDPRSKDNYDEKMEENWNLMCQYLKSDRDDCNALIWSDRSADLSLPVRNFSPTTRVEYLASKQDSNYLLVSREEYDWDGDVAVHYGKSGNMKLRQLRSILRARDGGSTRIKFMIDQQEAVAYFGVTWDSIGIAPGKSYLVYKGDTLQLERVIPSKEGLAELGFNCTHEIR